MGRASTKDAVSAPVRRTEPEPEPDASPRALAVVAEPDDRAFREIYDAHAAAVTRRLYHAVGDAEVARDLAQEAFATAFAKLARFRGDASVGTWLHAIAFNHLRDWRKRTRRRGLWLLRLSRERRPELPAPDEVVAARDDLSRLREAVMQLRPDLRDAYVLRVVEQVSLAEAAEILGARVATVSYRAKKAEALVRAAFEAQEESR